MVFVETFEDFEKAAERVYLNAPMKVEKLRQTRCVMKYDHSNSSLQVKVTDNTVCIQFKTDSQQELKKLEAHWESNETHGIGGEITHRCLYSWFLPLDRLSSM